VIDRRPDPVRSALLTVAVVAATTLVVYPLKQIAPAVSLGVVYLLGVLVVSIVSGLWFGLGTAVLSGLAFNYFHIAPVHRFTIHESENWVALIAFVVVAAVASSVAELARARAQDAERGRHQADLAASLARVLLGGGDRDAALREASALIAGAAGAREVVLEVPSRPGPPGRDAVAVELGDAGRMLVRGRLSADAEQRLREQIAPAVEALVSVAGQRDALQAEAVETAALRRSEELKTALLRMVSHDLRSPLTAIVTAAHALQSATLGDEDRTELARGVVVESERLARMVENLLDLSRLEAGVAAPRDMEVAVEEVVEAAAERVREHVEMRIAADVPLLRADAAQLERALANVIENAVRHAGERTVQVRAGLVGGRVVIRVVDAGRGMSDAESARIFEPFERGAGAVGSGSGLGLAIARGFVEANGGEIAVESVPGQGTSFVLTFPGPAADTVSA
jgi:two-component system sensor histidine kinase KdpD